MAEKTNEVTNGNGTINSIFGLLLHLLKTQGISAVLLLMIFYWAAWVASPPLISAHISFLAGVEKAIERITDANREIEKSVKSIQEIEDRSLVFMERSISEHQEMLDYARVERKKP